MRHATAIIGAHYGDEGKGLAVDYFAARSQTPLVVRYNSGAQCSHTVVRSDGRKHVFGHLGAGTFVGAPTHLSRFFVSNPLLLDKEYPVVEDISPVLFADPRGLVTTPYDILINQIVETSRGTSRHGSCGIGFNETVERSQNPAFTLRVEDLEFPDKVQFAMKVIGNRWVPARLAALGIPEIPQDAKEVLNSQDMVQSFIESCLRYRANVAVLKDEDILNEPHEIIFEGGQGLLLDEFHPNFPYVTRSRTGLPNILTLSQEAGVQVLNVKYMSRCYVTRHGAGPFPTEDKDFLKKYPATVDTTNVQNPWQESIRYGALDPLEMLVAIAADLAHTVDSPVGVWPSLFITCMDQMDSADILGHFAKKLPVTHMSYGPTRYSVVER